MVKRKYLFLSILCCITLLLCIGFAIPNLLNKESVNASSVAGNKTDKFSYASTSESSSGYGSNAGGVQGENKAYSSNCIEIYYDTKTTSTNAKDVYEAVAKVVVKSSALPDWSGFIWGSHSIESGTAYVQIFKDGQWTENLSATLKGNSSATFNMSGLNEKYDCYTFKVLWEYKIDWHNWPNSGKKYIQCYTNDFYVNSKGISAYLTKSVFDVNNNTFTDTIVNGGVYKTDNKNLSYRWNLTTYDNTTDTINVFGAVCEKNGNALPNYEFKRDGAKGYDFTNFSNGTYILKLKTDVGKSLQYTLIFEAFDPLLNIESGVRRENVYCIEYKSKISWTDLTSVKSVQLNGNTLNNGTVITPGTFGISWGIEYKIIVTRTTDATEEYTIVFTNKEQVDLNANQDSFDKSPIARWYETYLSDTAEERVYNSWASYENALKFAIERENLTVTTAYYDGGTWTAGIGMDDPINRKPGNYYIYKQRGNSSEKNAYFTKEALDSSILEYATASITNNTYFTKSAPASAYLGEIVYKKYSDENNENLFLLNSFTISKRPYVDLWVDLADGTGATKINFGYETTVSFSTPGLYHISEVNPFGDSVTYHIYISKSAPIVEYTMKLTSLTQTLTSENTRFGTYFDLTLFDYDTDSLLVVEKNGIGSVAVVYTYAELLQLRNEEKFENNFLFKESGEYTVTAVNHWTAYYHAPINSYSFFVSVNEPFINEPSVNREKNELTMSYGIPVGEYNTHITSVVIKKYIEADDVWETLTTDSKGNSISPDITSYTFNTKGYYTIIITDNFARTYERSYAFSREKPSATLTLGTSERIELDEDDVGYFNKRVTITWYDNSITAKMYGVSYTWNGDVMIRQNLNAQEYISGTAITSEGYYIIELMDIDYNSRRFTFFIDQKAPTMKLLSADKEFNSGEFKNTDIKTTYTPNSEYESPITVNVKKDTFPIQYPVNGIFTEEGKYDITLIDGAGNSSTYSFTIDKTAPAGQLFLQDGTEFTINGITNKDVYCTWYEEGVTATCNDSTYYKGALCSNSANDTKSYRIVLTDKAGNTSVYTFQISQDIPIITMKTESGKVIANNTTIDEAFTITWDDPNYQYKIEIVKGTKAEVFTNYTEMTSRMFKFSESGSYRFTFTGGNGNTYIYRVNANMRPSAIISAGVEYLGAYAYTNKNVVVTVSDRNSTIEVFKLDENNDYKTFKNWSLSGFTFTITEDGSYRITIQNDFDLSNSYYFTIKTSLPTATILNETGAEIKNDEKYAGEVSITYDTNEIAELKLYKNGEIVYGDHSKISDAGRYMLVLTDKAGNQNSYTFTIVESDAINWAGVVTLIVLVVGIITLAVFLFLKFKRPFHMKRK